MRKKLNKKKSPLLDEIEQRRIVSILFVVALLFIILFVKLYVVMIVDSSKYKKKSFNFLSGTSSSNVAIVLSKSNSKHLIPLLLSSS